MFDEYYTKLDYSVIKDNLIYLNASGARYDAFGFLNCYKQPSNEANDRLCVALQMKLREDAINQDVFDNEYRKVTLLHLYLL